MYVKEGAQQQLMADERKRFLNTEWPRIIETVRRLGLEPAELIKATEQPATGGAT